MWAITIGVIGAGIMGQGVAQRFSHNGFKVILLDLNNEVLSKSKASIERNLKFAGMINKSIKSEEIIKRILFTDSYSELADVRFIVENVPEKLELKKSVYTDLDNNCSPECVYLANTSCIPITKIASFTNKAENVIGVHFMNPVPEISFSEVIRGEHTSENTVNQTIQLLSKIGISAEVVKDSAGFVSNRLSHLFMNEAMFLVQENIATPEQIDNIFIKAFGHKMGPLATADLIGLDTVLDSLGILYDEFEDPKFRACPLLKKKVYAGELGRKTKKGFFSY